MARRIGLGHHSAWRETDHPRDDDGKFAPSPGHGHHHTTPNTAAAAPAPTRGMPNILTGADIRTRAGQDLALDRNLDGSLTLANADTSVHLSKSAGNDLRHAIDKLQDDGIEPGRESWISTIDTSGQPRNVVMAAKEKGGRLSLRIAPRPDATIDDIRSSQPIILGKTDLGKIDDAFLRMDAASRVDTGNGPVDLLITEDNRFAIRQLGDDGHPVEIEFDPKSFLKISRAEDVVVEGYDEMGYFRKGDAADNVTSLDIPTNVGKVHVEQKGTYGGDQVTDRLEITPADGDDTWGVYVDGTHQREWADALNRVEETAEALGFYYKHE